MEKGTINGQLSYGHSGLAAHDQLGSLNSREVQRAHGAPPVQIGRLPPLSHQPSPLQQSATLIIDKRTKRAPKMDRQNSTSPLVQNGLDDSLTSSDLSGYNKATPVTLARKTSQVQPITEKVESCTRETCKTPDSTHKPDTTSCAATAGRIIVSLIVGMYFGWFLQKSTVYKPQVIRNQFLFREFIMLKTFLAALLSSQISIVVLSYIPQTKPYIILAKEAYTAALCHKGIISTVIGAFLLGAGMAIAGACPGMVLAQNGSLVPNSAYTTLGGLLGCLVYGLLHSVFIKVTTPAVPYSTQFIHEKLKVPFLALAIPCSVFCLAAITIMEVFIPESEHSKPLLKSFHQSTVPSNTSVLPESVSQAQPELSLASCTDEDTWFTQEMWSPSVSGVFIGLVQIPIILLLTDTMGSSSGYQTIASQWVVTKSLQEKFPYFAKARTGIENWWMMVYILGAAAGGCLAALSSCTLLKAPGPPWWQALLGGFIMLFGSRFASGCTSGHGISGAALLVGLSWLAVPAMFAGGIVAAFTMEYSGTNNFVTSWQP